MDEDAVRCHADRMPAQRDMLLIAAAILFLVWVWAWNYHDPTAKLRRWCAQLDERAAHEIYFDGTGCASEM